jgi:hypothetical protein
METQWISYEVETEFWNIKHVLLFFSEINI